MDSLIWSEWTLMAGPHIWLITFGGWSAVSLHQGHYAAPLGCREQLIPAITFALCLQNPAAFLRQAGPLLSLPFLDMALKQAGLLNPPSLLSALSYVYFFRWFTFACYCFGRLQAAQVLWGLWFNTTVPTASPSTVIHLLSNIYSIRGRCCHKGRFTLGLKSLSAGISQGSSL